MAPEIDFTAAEKDLIRAIRSTRSFSFCTMSFPERGFPDRSIVDARRAVPLPQWLITREKFQDAVASEYLDLAVGQSRMLIAPTGIGKSTKLPFIITQTHSHNGLVLCPDNLLATLLAGYVSRKVVTGKVKAVLLRTRHMKKPEVGPTVYYTSAAEFLFRYAAYPNLLTDLGLQYIYVDEAHENRPEYYFLRMLVASDFLPSVRVFFGTATSGTFNMENSSGADRQVEKVSLDQLSVGNLENLQSDSPLHFRNITVRTLIFVADPIEAFLLHQYYTDHDVQSFLYTEETSTLEYSEVSKLISTCGAGALITTWVLQTGHTFDIDAVIDCGQTRFVSVTPNPMRLELRKRFVTVAEQKQRAGRVGRHMKGKAYMANVKHSPSESEIREGAHVYVYLWSVLFNLNIRDEEISVYNRILKSAVTGKALTREKSAILLNSTIHPLIMFSFLDDYGKFYKGWVNILRKTMNGAAARESSLSNEEKASKWPERNTKNDIYIEQIDKYKLAFEVPAEWEVIFHIAYCKYSGVIKDFTYLDNRSVLSMVPPSVVPKRSQTIKSFFRPLTIRESFVSNNFSDAPSLEHELVAEPQINSGLADGAVRDWISHVSETTEPVIRTDFEQLQIKANVVNEQDHYQYNEIVPYKASPKLRSMSFDNDLAPSRNTITMDQRDSDIVLKHIFAKSASNVMRLYPMDISVRRQFFIEEIATDFDDRRVTKCITNRISIATLDREELVEFFISFVKVWNSKIILRMQQAAPVRGAAKNYTRALVKSADAIQKSLRELKALLTICEQFRLYVGYDVRVVHGFYEDGSMTPSYDKEQQAAIVSMSWGSINAKQNVQLLQLYCEIHTFDKGLFGIYFNFSGFAIGVAHVFHRDNIIVRPDSVDCRSIVYDPDNDLVIWISEKRKRSTVLLRVPINEEYVYVVGRNLLTFEIEIYGVFQVFGNGETWVIDKTFNSGYSGSAIVAVSDGKCLGFYTGMAPGTQGYYGTMIDYGKIENYALEIYIS